MKIRTISATSTPQLHTSVDRFDGINDNDLYTTEPTNSSRSIERIGLGRGNDRLLLVLLWQLTPAFIAGRVLKLLLVLQSELQLSGELKIAKDRTSSISSEVYFLRRN